MTQHNTAWNNTTQHNSVCVKLKTRLLNDSIYLQTNWEFFEVLQSVISDESYNLSILDEKIKALSKQQQFI